MSESKTISTPAVIKPDYVLTGYYLQDFDEPAAMPPDEKTGEVKYLDYHRVIFVFSSAVDPDRWGVKECDGTCSVEFPVNIEDLPYCFGKSPEGFDFYKEYEALKNKGVDLSFTFSKKGKPTLRRIRPF